MNQVNSKSTVSTEYAVVVDWHRCILCQTTTSEPLQKCPADSKRTYLGAGYESLGNNLQRFQGLQSLTKVGH